MTAIQTYFNVLKNTDLSTITEHSLRGDLKNLFTALAPTGTTVLHEGKREGKFGAPDFKISGPAGIIGYVENKKIGEDLSRILKTDQIKKYSELSDNILITDYLEWIWLKNGKQQARTRLCYAEDLSNSRFKPSPDREQEVTALIEGFLSQAPKGINNAKALAKALATRTRNLKEFLEAELTGHLHDDEHGPLIGLYETFRGNISAELTDSEFCDAFAQMLSYGLFLAKLNADTKTVDLYNAKRFIPHSFELIKELMGFLDRLENAVYKDVKWIVDEILSVLNNLDLPAIQETLSFNQKSNGEIADPYLYFYEDFLGQYDRKLREQKGVYYTPPAVVNFIVRAVNDTLKDTFGITDGLADRNRVTVLDFATGTGTFLLEVVKQIMERIPANSPKRKLIIQEHVLKNIYGFEYLIAPYTVAHLKLSQYLKENGYEVGKENANERLQIYLTNTLEPLNTQYSAFLPALSREGKEAQKVKDKPILVIVGNPPYSGHSKNNGAWIKDKIRDYSFVDGEPLGESNTKWLQDDYVKFIRFAQWKMEQVEEGIIAIITNHSFLDNTTFRGMRKSLMKSFDQLYLFDLHGSAKKKQLPVHVDVDENVFDIEQGVSISLFLKKSGLRKGIFKGDLWGKRETKYDYLSKTTLADIVLEPLTPQKPLYLFKKYETDGLGSYDAYLPVNKIFKVEGMGVTTARDSLTIQFSKEDVKRITNDFSKLSVEVAREKYSLKKDARDWQIALAQKDLLSSKLSDSNIKQITYRPFDVRYTYFTGHSKGFHCMPRGEVMQHLIRPNVALLFNRFVNGSYRHGFVAEHLIDNCTLSNLTKERTYAAPLYLYETGSLFSNSHRQPNFKSEFVSLLKEKGLDCYTPEEIMGYVYSILSSTFYRNKYAEFLKADFPRIPFTDDLSLFKALSDLGWTLIQAHLLKFIPATGLGEYTGAGANVVEKPVYNNRKLYVNPAQYFDNVPVEVYGFQIGGYQVLDKYLKDRKGRTLSLDEIENVEKVVKVLAFTIEQMQKIDELTRDWI